jgi:hypothetical protein
LPGPDQSTRSPGDWCRYIDREGDEWEVDLSGLKEDDLSWKAMYKSRMKGPPHDGPEPRRRVWKSWRGDRPDEILYIIPDNQGRADHGLLRFPGRDDIQDRKLNLAESTYWLKINGHEIPSDLRHITTATTDAAYPLLHRDWRPPPRSESGAAPSDPHEHDRTRPPAAATDASGSKATPPAVASQKRTRGPRQISKIQRAIALLKYRAKTKQQSIRIQDIASDSFVACSAQNLYNSPEFMKEYKNARARRFRRGWKVDGVADCPDDSTPDGG